MSVINQMLKDLEDRNPAQSNKSNQATATTQKTSSIKVIFITIGVLLLLNGLGLYIWSLIQENRELNTKNITLAATVTQDKVQTKTQAKTQAKAQEKNLPIALQHKEVKPQSRLIKPEQIKPRPQVKSLEHKTTATIPPVATVVVDKEELSKPNISKQINSKQATSKQNIAIKTTIQNKNLTSEAANVDVLKPKTSMSVSRRQLTSEELIEQKISKAEKAINANNLTKAEQLFEEILIIDPKQQQVRKKLAALWFGRKSFNEAINLLSQGIALAPENSELRSMQAHVYLQKGNLKQAYNSLRALADLPQQEYQLLIVNITQQLSNYDAAINAYKILLDLQPENSRWHLGLATIYDKTSEFVLAVSEYNLALAQGGLSQDSSHFAMQRIQALGVK